MKTNPLRMVAASLLLALLIRQMATGAETPFTDDNWASGATGALSIGCKGGFAYSIVTDDAGHLYIGGSFESIGDVVTRNIAKWDGRAWSPLGSGLDGIVNALAVSGRHLYAAFTTWEDNQPKATIARWDGIEWINWTSLVLEWGGISHLAVLGNHVYAAGALKAENGLGIEHLAKWDGTQWSALGTGLNGAVTALASADGQLYVAGHFTTAGGVEANGIARWDGSTWSSLGAGVEGGVSGLAISGTDLHVVGGFGIQKWDGRGWSPLIRMEQGVFSLAVSGNAMYAVVFGYWRAAGWMGIPVWNIVRWNGAEWLTIGEVSGNDPLLVVSGSYLFAAGTFNEVNGIRASGVARWDGNRWSGLGEASEGFEYSVEAIAADGEDLYAAGSFRSEDHPVAIRIAKWVGHKWSPITRGHSLGRVNALALSGRDLYAAGQFTAIDGIEANRVARWNGEKWMPLGSGLEPDASMSWAADSGGEVRALAVHGSDLYVAGNFNLAGGQPARRIAKWDGNQWSPLGSGIHISNQEIHNYFALAVAGGDLYLGGQFQRVGDVSARNIARWDGSTWSRLGAGVDGVVNALAVSGGDLYVAGGFRTAGGKTVNNIAKWDGTTWSPVGTGIAGRADSLVVAQGDLYAAGWFNLPGAGQAYGISRWNGRQWSPLGSGVEGYVRALATSGDQLFVGGSFTVAGGKVSAYFARAFLKRVPAIEVTGGRATVYFRGIGAGGYGIERTTDLEFWEHLATRYAGTTGGIDFVDENAPGPSAYYRAVPLEP
jgi:trimeric autotransporter adhesin